MRIVHYLNQFFGGLGGEDRAEHPLTLREGAVGPGRALAAKLPEGIEIVGTLVCGDNTAQAHPERVRQEALAHLQALEADLLVCGPAFESGRYGLACASVAGAAAEHGWTALVAMHPDNPGIGLCPAGIPVVIAGRTALDMTSSLDRLARVVLQLRDRGALDQETRRCCVRRNIRRNRFDEERGAKRAVKRLLEKIRRRPCATEIRPPRFPRVDPAPPVRTEAATVALITTGGLVPRGNPDRLEASSATKWLAYPLGGHQTLTPEKFECIHAGIDTSHVNADPNRLLPVDMIYDLESRGLVGGVDDQLYVTVGNLTPVAQAELFAAEIAARLRERRVDAAVLTST